MTKPDEQKSIRENSWSLQESPYLVKEDSADDGEDGLHKGRAEPDFKLLRRVHVTAREYDRTL